jgi:hypothetical protein
VPSAVICHFEGKANKICKKYKRIKNRVENKGSKRNLPSKKAYEMGGFLHSFSYKPWCSLWNLF